MKDRAVSNWLFLLAFMVFGMTVGGGHARTIGASFIMQSWDPVTGFIPPRSAADWARQFGLFQQTVAFHAHPISLAEYQALFWPMFLDRCWGRLMALVLLAPLAWFWWRKQISPGLALWVLAIFAAGAAQAVFGWFMVETGRHVLAPPAAYAAPHFFVAMLIFAALFQTALALRGAPAATSGALKPFATAGIVLLFVTMALGALVVGTSTLAHPDAVMPVLHRWVAGGTTLVLLLTTILALRDQRLTQAQRDLFLAQGGLVAVQFLLGLVTLALASADLGYLHELNAVLLLATALAARHALGSGRFLKKAPQKLLLQGAKGVPNASV